MPCECATVSMYAVQYAGLGQAVARYLPPQTRYLVPRGQDPAGGIMDPSRYLVAVVTDIWWLSWQISGRWSQISGLRQISCGPRPDIWCHGSMIPPAGCWTQPDIWSKPARFCPKIQLYHTFDRPLPVSWFAAPMTAGAPHADAEGSIRSK